MRATTPPPRHCGTAWLRGLCVSDEEEEDQHTEEEDDAQVVTTQAGLLLNHCRVRCPCDQVVCNRNTACVQNACFKRVADVLGVSDGLGCLGGRDVGEGAKWALLIPVAISTCTSSVSRILLCAVASWLMFMA